MLKSLLTAGVLALSGVAATSAQSAIVRVDTGSFSAAAGLITFSEVATGTTNPVYTPAMYGGGASAPTVTFGGYFTGQSLSATPDVDCPGAAATGCVVGVPTAFLSLDPSAPLTFVTPDGAAPNSPVLSGTPLFSGPIAVLFSADQYGVGFDGGYFDAVGSTAITAFDRMGNLLGSVSNTGLGIEFLGLLSDQGNIAGVFLDLVGAEPAGFAIDSIRFGLQGQVVNPNDPTDPGPAPVPLPAGFPLLLAGLGALAVARRRATR